MWPLVGIQSSFTLKNNAKQKCPVKTSHIWTGAANLTVHVFTFITVYMCFCQALASTHAAS